MPIPTIAFVGHSGSGKTTLLEALLPQLTQRGYRVAVIKHTWHRDIATDVPGADTRRLWDAGAAQTLLVSPERVAHTYRCASEPPLPAILEQIHDVDLILLEGFKRADVPKIEVLRAAHNPAPLTDLPDRIAFVTDVPHLSADVPCFALDAWKSLADFIMKFLSEVDGVMSNES